MEVRGRDLKWPPRQPDPREYDEPWLKTQKARTAPASRTKSRHFQPPQSGLTRRPARTTGPTQSVGPQRTGYEGGVRALSTSNGPTGNGPVVNGLVVRVALLRVLSSCGAAGGPWVSGTAPNGAENGWGHAVRAQAGQAGSGQAGSGQAGSGQAGSGQYGPPEWRDQVAALPPWGEDGTAAWATHNGDAVAPGVVSDDWGNPPTLHSGDAWGTPVDSQSKGGAWHHDNGQGRGRHPRKYPPVAWGVLAAAVLLAGGAGAAIALAVTNGGTSGSPSSRAAAPSSGQPGSVQGLNVHSVAAGVDPATVDITAAGSNGQDEGTGMVVTSSGAVLTNNHVIDGSTQLSVQIDGSGKTYPATVVGTDATDDVALLQMQGGADFRTVSLGDSNAIAVGDPVVAIGNALGLSGPETVTNGIISATGRSVTVGDPSTGLTESLNGLFQTSAPINPGNSGGPLVDAAGKVIGMNTAQESSTGSGQSASNVGFAIPINTAMAIARQIQAGDASTTVQIGPHAIMGVEVTTIACAEGKDGCSSLGSSSPFSVLPFIGSSGYTAPVKQGAVVSGVEQGDPAEAAGMASGDVITSIDGTVISSPTALTGQMNLQKVGGRVTVDWVDPKGRHRSATLSLVQGPNG